MRQGQVYWWIADDGKRRPAVVVSREELNTGDYVSVVPFTTRDISVRARFPNCVLFRAGQCGLPRECVAQAEAIQYVLKDELDVEAGPIGILPPEMMRALVMALGHVLDAACEPN